MIIIIITIIIILIIIIIKLKKILRKYYITMSPCKFYVAMEILRICFEESLQNCNVKKQPVRGKKK